MAVITINHVGRALPAIILNNMLRNHTTIICPLPGMGHCVRERCNFWDEDHEECTCDCFDPGDPGEAGSSGNPDWPCVISFDEDYD